MLAADIVTDIVSLSAGFVERRLPPGLFVLVDQFITGHLRGKSFFERAALAMCHFPIPYRLHRQDAAAAACGESLALPKGNLWDGGSAVFTRLAESQDRSWEEVILRRICRKPSLRVEAEIVTNV
jgi:hypothetical protein